MRFLLLFLAGCPGTPKTHTASDTGADDTAAPTETATPTETAAIPDLTVTPLTAFGGDVGIYDFVHVPALGFLIGAPAGAGVIHQISPTSVTYPDPELLSWSGSRDGAGFGGTISPVSFGGGDLIASSEYCANPDDDCDYAGRWLAAPVSSPSGVFADVATIDLSGEIAGTGNTGGFFGRAAANLGDKLLVTQSNAFPSSYSYDDIGLTALDTYTDGVPDGGEGYVGMFARADETGATISIYGDYAQHVDLTGSVDWTLGPDGPVTEIGERNPLWVTRLSTLSMGAVVIEATANTYAHVRAVDPETGEVLREGSAEAISMADGLTAAGLYWLAEGIWDCIPAEAGEEDCTAGYLRVWRSIDGTPEGLAGDALAVALPFESPYECAPAVRSDGADTLAVACLRGSIGAVFTVR